MGHAVSFAVVATPRGGRAGWAEQVRTVEDLGFETLLVPDTLWTVSPFPALAAAAVAGERIRLRTWVLAAPMRSPAVVVREASALQSLSDGRFELGLGTGRPDARVEAERLGVPWPGGAERLAQLEAVAAAVRASVSPRPPVVLAAGGPRALAAAGRVADRVALAIGPDGTADALGTAVDRVRHSAPEARLTLQAMGVGDRVPEFLRRQGIAGGDLVARRSPLMLPEAPRALAETVARYRDAYGIDEVVIPAEFVREVAPAIGAR